MAKTLNPPRSIRAKKGDSGIVLVAGGSHFYHGSPVLASMAALRTGSDLVYTAVPRSIITAVRSFSPALIALPLPDDKLTVGAAGRLVAMLPKRCDSAAIGMGMSVAKPEALVALVRKLKELGTRLVLDASALVPPVLPEIAGTDSIVTPHAGEYRRLFGAEPAKEESERVAEVSEMARRHSVTILLKGPVDVISDGNKTGVNRTHNCAMTVGGTGDVLSGITAAFSAKMKPFDAALLAAYVNGSAGNLAYRRLGLHIVATDLLDSIPAAMKPLDRVVRSGS